MARTRGRSIANRIVSFHQPQIRPIVRGKEGKPVEFGPKVHVAVVGGYSFLDCCEFEAFHEGNRLKESLEHHRERFGDNPKVLLGDQIYATRANRELLKEAGIEHGFKRIGRPPTLPSKSEKRDRAIRRKRHGQRNSIEAAFGHLKQRFNLGKIKLRVPHGAQIQIRLGLTAANLHRAIA